jgi:hypothetical protein
MKVLHLTLKKKWFDMTGSGDKPDEYREIKPYWVNRLLNYHCGWNSDGTLKEVLLDFKAFDVIHARNGYSKNAPSWTRKCLFITIDYGKPEWGAEPGKKYFVIKLGERIN